MLMRTLRLVLVLLLLLLLVRVAAQLNEEPKEYEDEYE